jgi:DNA mismatch endonuclease (patch repair protein)
MLFLRNSPDESLCKFCALLRHRPMTDIFSPSERSAIMARIRSRDTLPEMVVRKLLHRLGYRFRLHRSTLPGTPDIIFASRRKVIFVHGCFWHGHAGCRKSALPKTRHRFWLAKISGNLQRDRSARARLSRSGWKSFVVWQCQLRDLVKLEKKLRRFLADSPIQPRVQTQTKSGSKTNPSNRRPR